MPHEQWIYEIETERARPVSVPEFERMHNQSFNISPQISRGLSELDTHDTARHPHSKCSRFTTVSDARMQTAGK